MLRRSVSPARGASNLVSAIFNPLIAAALATILALSACSNVVPVMPKPSNSLLTDCAEPQLIPDADKQTADDINIERAEVAKYAVCNRGKFHGLRDWVRGMVK